MSDAQREEAYLNKMLNRGKDPDYVKKNVFGGGLEAARAKQNKPTTTDYYETEVSLPPPPTSPKYVPPPPKPKPYVPPPTHGAPRHNQAVGASYNYEKPDTTSYVPDMGISPEEAARREEERVAKSIGRFVAPKAGGGQTYAPPPSQYNAPSNTYYNSPTTHYNAPSHTQYNPPATTYYNAPKTIAHGDDFVYPAFKIGAISPVDNSCNILPITSLACDVNELYLGIRQNGKKIEFHRSVVQQGKPRKEVQTLTLPYQVTPSTTSATYYPNKNNGELAIRFGKEVPRGQNIESEVARFSVEGVVGSPKSSVQIAVDQASDHFTFRPAAPSAYLTDFTVLIVGSSLEFKSTYSYDDGDSIKTVNGKQTVNLPIPPTLDQIDVAGDTITLWQNRGGGPEKVVGDCDVYISLG